MGREEQGRPDQLPEVRRSVSSGLRRGLQAAMARLILRRPVAPVQPRGTALGQGFARFFRVLAQAVLNRLQLAAASLLCV